MLITVKTQDGATFDGDTARRVVSLMRRDNWNAPARKLEYMEEVSERVFQSTGETVRADAPEHFLGDLQRAGMLTIFLAAPVPAKVLTLALDAVRVVAAGRHLEDPELPGVAEKLNEILALVGCSSEGVATT